LALAPKATGGGSGKTVPLPAVVPSTFSTQEDNGVKFSGALSQAKLVQGGNGLVYLDLSIETPAAPLSASGAKASDMVVVLDRSGSMAADNRLPYAKEAVRSLVSRLHAEDRFALVTFDSVAVVNIDLSPVTEAMREQIVQRLHTIQPGSSTNISDGLLKARALFKGPAGERGRKVILLSDGEANMGIVDPKELAKIAASFSAHSAVLSTIGMGLGFNETLMASLADYGMGHYGYLEHLAKLGEILGQDMSDARQVFASASGLEISLGDGVTVTDAGGYPIDLTSQPGTARVVTGQLLGGATKHFVVTMTAPTNHIGEFGLGDITLHYDTSNGTRHVSLPRASLHVAVLEPARRDEAVASVNQGLFRQLWENNNLGRLQKEYSHWLRVGDKAKAEQMITDYRQALQAAESATGVAVESQPVIDKLSSMEQELKDAFAGPPAQQEEKRNRAAKSRHIEALKSQRSQ
jgi:Ca-activated chloride channel family protein